MAERLKFCEKKYNLVNCLKIMFRLGETVSCREFAFKTLLFQIECVYFLLTDYSVCEENCFGFNGLITNILSRTEIDQH